MTMDVPEDVFFGTRLRKCVRFGVVAEFSMVFLFGLEFEFLEDLWNRKSLASVSAVQLGVFCDGRKFSG